MRRRIQRLACVALSFSMLTVTLSGCRAQEAPAEKVPTEIQIPISLSVDPTTGKKGDEDLVTAFNEEYAGKYHLDVTWVLETEDERRRSLKVKNATDQLPAVLTDVRTVPSFYRLLIDDHRIEDLSEEIANDPEWQQIIEPVVMDNTKDSDGNLYLAPISSGAFTCSGMFYNTELFAKAGIESFPATWDEFFKDCDLLKASGITPLALHTEGTGWAPMLIATAKMGETEEGRALMNQIFPSTYESESFEDLAQTLKKLFSYASDDCFNTDFDSAYEKFFSGQAAMIPNGYWMIESIPSDFKNKTRFSAFPGNVLIASPETFGWAITACYSDEIKKGALEFLKFRAKRSQDDKRKFLTLGGSTLAEQDYIKAYLNSPYIMKNYQTLWNSNLQEKVIPADLPDLARGKISTHDFVLDCNKSIAEFKEK